MRPIKQKLISREHGALEFKSNLSAPAGGSLCHLNQGSQPFLSYPLESRSTARSFRPSLSASNCLAIVRGFRNIEKSKGG
jgi:hypothetical protein